MLSAVIGSHHVLTYNWLSVIYTSFAVMGYMSSYALCFTVYST
jgi:hypothetical protein